MAQDFARDFYNSPAWKLARNAYATKRHYLCEDAVDVMPGPYSYEETDEPIPDNVFEPGVAGWSEIE